MLRWGEARWVYKTITGDISHSNICQEVEKPLVYVIKLVKFLVFQDSEGPILSYDPLPPLDSINLYVRPQRPKIYEHSNAFTMFFRSLLPNFNISEPAPGVDGLHLM